MPIIVVIDTVVTVSDEIFTPKHDGCFIEMSKPRTEARIDDRYYHAVACQSRSMQLLDVVRIVIDGVRSGVGYRVCLDVRDRCRTVGVDICQRVLPCSGFHVASAEWPNQFGCLDRSVSAD